MDQWQRAERSVRVDWLRWRPSRRNRQSDEESASPDLLNPRPVSERPARESSSSKRLGFDRRCTNAVAKAHSRTPTLRHSFQRPETITSSAPFGTSGLINLRLPPCIQKAGNRVGETSQFPAPMDDNSAPKPDGDSELAPVQMLVDPYLVDHDLNSDPSVAGISFSLGQTETSSEDSWNLFLQMHRTLTPCHAQHLQLDMMAIPWQIDPTPTSNETTTSDHPGCQSLQVVGAVSGAHAHGQMDQGRAV